MCATSSVDGVTHDWWERCWRQVFSVCCLSVKNVLSLYSGFRANGTTYIRYVAGLKKTARSDLWGYGTTCPEFKFVRRHSFKFALGLAGVAILALLVMATWQFAVSLIWDYHDSERAAKPKFLDPNNPKEILSEADRLAWVFNSQAAEPLYARAEQLFAKSGDQADEIHARVGLIRAKAETMSFVDISQSLAKELEKSVVQNDPRLKLWVLAAKGYTDIEINPSSAKKEWQEARDIASRLGEKQWVERADGELAIFGFLDGDSTRAAGLIASALLHAIAYGDAGGQVRFLEMIGSGLEEEKRYENALYFFVSVRRIHPGGMVSISIRGGGRPCAPAGGVRSYGVKRSPARISARHSSRGRSCATSHHWPVWRK